MNKQLIEDDGSRNAMSPSELESRMAVWIDGDWQAVLVERDGEPVGYILFQFRSDEYQPAEKTVCVRQFFIKREHRGQGIGRRAFNLIADPHFSHASSIVLDVLETNPRARRFWKTLGFQPYCTTMRRT